MKQIYISLATVGLAACAAVYMLTTQQPASTFLASSAADDSDFINYLSAHGKSYKTQNEYKMRLGHYKKKDDFVKKHNALKNVTYTVAHNKFSDWTDEEYKKLLGFIAPPANRLLSSEP